MTPPSSIATPSKNTWKPPLWLIVACGCTITMLAFGPRSAMGFFQAPILADKGWSFTTFGLAMAIQNLAWGIGQPIFGAIADKYGAWRMLAIGGVIYAAGLYLMGTTDSTLGLHIGGGVLVGLGIAAGSFGIILSVFARHVTPEKRSLVFGIGTAAGSAGMFIFAPISVSLISKFGWSHTLILLSALMLIVPLLAIPLFGNAASSPQASSEFKQTALEAMKEALAHKSYLLLISGFFVCGFQVAFITAHFPAYINDIGIDAAYAGYAIALIGFFNIFGALASGVIGQKYSKANFLSLIYIGRSIAVAAFLLLPQTPTSVIIFAAVMGILWLSTVPPTNGLVAIMFGTRHLGLLGGIVFFSHQVGSFLGVYFGGYLRDVYGTFDIVWWFGVVLGLFAAIVHWPIQEKPIERPIQAV
ncbi:MAG: MFS transporter [Rhizobiaceae bacterium]